MSHRISQFLALAALWWLLSAAGCQLSSPALHSSVASPASPRAKGPLAQLERSLMFFPSPYPEGNWTPDGLQFEDAWIAAPGGEPGGQLHGWFCPHPQPRAVLLYCHGNSGNVSHCASTLRELHDLGVAALAFDYRGYGRSTGTPDEAGILADARAARAWLADRTGVPPQEIVIMGRSLGGGVAVDLAARDGARGLVLESTFTSLPAVAASKAGRPVTWLMRSRLNSLEKIGQYAGPVLIRHGDADRLIPFSQGQQLYEAAPGPKQFVRIPGGDHNCPANAEFWDGLEAMLVSTANRS